MNFWEECDFHVQNSNFLDRRWLRIQVEKDYH
jgi:hypothetical protein